MTVFCQIFNFLPPQIKFDELIKLKIHTIWNWKCATMKELGNKSSAKSWQTHLHSDNLQFCSRRRDLYEAIIKHKSDRLMIYERQRKSSQ